MCKKLELAGKNFGRLKVIRQVGKNKFGNYTWLCKCNCGNEKVVVSSHLKSGHTKSCGCFHTERLKTGNITHGMRYSPEYKSWSEMKIRCLNKNHRAYKNYGGRGITVCKEWLKFEIFYKDMGERPSKNHSIDRIDNNKGYSKENCRWATPKEQARNKRNNKMIRYKGETLCLAEWAEKLNIDYNVLRNRLHRGWSIKRTFITN